MIMNMRTIYEEEPWEEEVVDTEDINLLHIHGLVISIPIAIRLGLLLQSIQLEMKRNWKDLRSKSRTCQVNCRISTRVLPLVLRRFLLITKSKKRGLNVSLPWETGESITSHGLPDHIHLQRNQRILTHSWTSYEMIIIELRPILRREKPTRTGWLTGRRSGRNWALNNFHTCLSSSQMRRHSTRLGLLSSI